MKIIVDAMGGDRFPDEIVKGVADASLAGTSRFALVGDTELLKKSLEGLKHDPSAIEIVGAECAVTMEDDPMSILGSKRNSSMSVGLKMLKTDGDAFVSAGNTGALFTGASTIIRNVPGVKRAAIATLIPFERPILLLDSGANVNVLPEYFIDWAHLGSLYSEFVLGAGNPAVGLLNNGAESHKGGAMLAGTYALLEKEEGINFVGNVESYDLPGAPCDVLLTDGFTGNVTLKLIEGLSVYFFRTMKHLMTETVFTKVFSAPLSGKIKSMKRVFDPTEYGGAPILGLRKPVIKAHGHSDARAITAAIRQAEAFVMADVTGMVIKWAAKGETASES
ncbi:MAG: phosphate acyltransferase PlsX [Clostridia bacterium]|nr:phosphate acyltransferase PlsX [Clostridia bacterium]